MIKCYIFGDDSTKQLISSHLSSLSPIFYTGMSNDYRTTFIDVARNKPDVVLVDAEIVNATIFDMIALKELCTVMTLTNIKREAFIQQSKKDLELDGRVEPAVQQMLSEAGIAYSDREKNEKVTDRCAESGSVVIRTTMRGLCGVIEVTVKFATISYIKSDKNYLNIYLDDGTHYRTHMTLKAIKTILPTHFNFVNKSFIIDYNKITSTEGNDFITLNNYSKNRIPVGGSHKSKIAEWKKSNKFRSSYPS
ncbi:LytTR family transcriptional regulator DNA-binding domain-containing protein [Arcticibacter sp.]|uniref:LytTR family transcriptional regulator DNA-binding domain-containing protein n=1 Tax=Arcticibacter sp. TaxID=1872630 RepID=UPI00388D398A